MMRHASRPPSAHYLYVGPYAPQASPGRLVDARLVVRYHAAACSLA
jgi:hypothetical protein